jgi:hypothetical protein
MEELLEVVKTLDEVIYLERQRRVELEKLLRHSLAPRAREILKAELCRSEVAENHLDKERHRKILTLLELAKESGREEEVLRELYK